MFILSLKVDILTKRGSKQLPVVPPELDGPGLQRTFKIYQFCVNSDNFAIDWIGFKMWCEYYEVEDYETEAEYLDCLRRMQSNRDELEKEINKDLEVVSNDNNAMFMNSVSQIKERKIKEREEARAKILEARKKEGTS